MAVNIRLNAGSVYGGEMRLVRRRSKIAGYGVYAGEPINKNKRIVTYDGEMISARELDRREQKYQKKGFIWCFTVDKKRARDGNSGGNIARFINHACKPNCYAEVVGDTIWIRAAKNIKRGEELTYDYNTGGEAGIPCECRPGCKNVL
jgi:SET domain-containing protein